MTPATLLWTGDGPNNLASNGLNWSGLVPPAAGDHLLFDGAAGPNSNKAVTMDVATVDQVEVLISYTATFSVANDLTATTRFVATDVTISANADTKVTSHEIRLIAANKDVNVIGARLLLGGLGVLPINGGGVPAGAAAVFTGTSAVLLSGGASFFIGAGAKLTIETNLTLPNSTSQNDGTIDWTGGNVRHIGGDALVINAGTINTTANKRWDGDGAINNFGKFNKTAGVGTTTIGVVMNSVPLPIFGPKPEVTAATGTVEYIGLSSMHAAKFSAAAGSLIRFSPAVPVGMSQTFGAGTVFTGGGTIQFLNARATFGSEQFENLWGTTVKISGTSDLSNGQFDMRGKLVWESGTSAR